MVVKKVTAVAALEQQRITPCLSLESVDVETGEECGVSIRLAIAGVVAVSFSGKGNDEPRAAVAAISAFLKEAGFPEIELKYSHVDRPGKTWSRYGIRFTTSRGYDGGARGETIEEAVRQMVFYCLRNAVLVEGVLPL